MKLDNTSGNGLKPNNQDTSAEAAVIVTLSTIPPRLPNIMATLLSLAKQTRPPHEIVLCIPFVSRRFPNEEYQLAPLVAQLESFNLSNIVTVFRTLDYGPATKFIPTILREQRLNRNPFVVLADDDVVGRPNFVI